MKMSHRPFVLEVKGAPAASAIVITMPLIII